MSKRRVLGSADDDIVFFLHMPFFIDLFFADHEHVFFLENTCKFCIFIFAIRCCIFSAYYDMFYWSWVDLFCNLHAYSAYLQYMEDTGRSKMRQKNWSFRGFRTKYLGLECPSGIFPRYSLRQCKC